MITAAGSLLAAPSALAGFAPGEKIRPAGPASRYRPRVQAAFVRRKGDYGMLWPGKIYDGEAARRSYAEQVTKAAAEIGIDLDLRAEPIYSHAEADAWLGGDKPAPDGRLVVLLDRQAHAWPTAAKAMDGKTPAVIFSPLGSSFTTNTAPLAKKPGAVIVSTDDFRQVRYGLKMLHARAKMRQTRCLVIAGTKRAESVLPHLGIQVSPHDPPDHPEIMKMGSRGHSGYADR